MLVKIESNKIKTDGKLFVYIFFKKIKGEYESYIVSINHIRFVFAGKIPL